MKCGILATCLLFHKENTYLGTYVLSSKYIIRKPRSGARKPNHTQEECVGGHSSLLCQH